MATEPISNSRTPQEGFESQTPAPSTREWIDSELNNLETGLRTGHVSGWDLSLQDIRDQAGDDWTGADQSRAETIAYLGMRGDVIEIDASKDARSRQINIDIAQSHNRTYRSYGVDVFSDNLRRDKTLNQFDLAVENGLEAQNQQNQSLHALIDRDLSAAWRHNTESQRSKLQAVAALHHGVLRMIGFGSDE